MQNLFEWFIRVRLKFVTSKEGFYRGFGRLRKGCGVVLGATVGGKLLQNVVCVVASA